VEGTPAVEDDTGHELDAKANSSAVPTGMHYAGARYYMSALGRWTSTDPILREQAPRKLPQDRKVQAFWMSAYDAQRKPGRGRVYVSTTRCFWKGMQIRSRCPNGQGKPLLQ